MKFLRQMTVDEGGRGDIVQHAHPNNSRLNFVSGTLSSSQKFILIDISDTTNYKHPATQYIHIEDLDVQVDASLTANYELKFGFLTNVDDTNGDFYSCFNISSSNVAGRNKELYFPMYPNGQRMHLDYIVTSDKSLNDAAFQTDVNLASTIDPSTTDTPSGNGDVVLIVSISAGSIDVNINMSYHSH